MRIRQIVFAVRSLADTGPQLADLLELDPPFRDPAVAEFGLDNAVFAFGDQCIELVAPVRADSAAARWIERRGEGGYMLILQTGALGRDRARFAAMGIRTVFEATFPDIVALHLHPKDLGGAIVSVDEPTPAASWRWGGPARRVQTGERGRQRVVGITIEVREPRTIASRWADAFGLEAPSSHDDGYRLPLADGHVDFIPAAAHGEGIVGFTLSVVDPARLLRRAGELGLPVHGGSITLSGARLDPIALPDPPIDNGGPF